MDHHEYDGSAAQRPFEHYVGREPRMLSMTPSNSSLGATTFAAPAWFSAKTLPRRRDLRFLAGHAITERGRSNDLLTNTNDDVDLRPRRQHVGQIVGIDSGGIHRRHQAPVEQFVLDAVRPWPFKANACRL